MSLIGLVACSKTKLDRAAPARELYTSPLFHMSVRYLECWAMEIGVLSAQHGLVMLDDVIEPYDTTLVGLSRDERDLWAYRTNKAIVERWGRSQHFWFLGGRPYELCLAGLPVHPALRGKQIGERLHWLKAEIERCEPSAVHGTHSWTVTWKGESLGTHQGATIERVKARFWDPETWPLCMFSTRTRPKKEDVHFTYIREVCPPIAARRKRWLEERRCPSTQSMT
jgi:hypothetical protein